MKRHVYHHGRWYCYEIFTSQLSQMGRLCSISAIQTGTIVPLCKRMLWLWAMTTKYDQPLSCSLYPLSTDLEGDIGKVLSVHHTFTIVAHFQTNCWSNWAQICWALLDSPGLINFWLHAIKFQPFQDNFKTNQFFLIDYKVQYHEADHYLVICFMVLCIIP